MARIHVLLDLQSFGQGCDCLASDFLKTYWLVCHIKVQEKFSSSAISWNRAMDEVRTDRLMVKYGKDSLLVIIRDWPVSKKYKDKPEMVASLEYLVCLVNDFS